MKILVTDQLDIENPIIEGCMQRIGCAGTVAAIFNSSGLGITARTDAMAKGKWEEIALQKTGRFFNNSFSKENIAIEKRSGGAKLEDSQQLVSDERGSIALESGDINSGLVCAIQVIRLIDDIPTCAELTERKIRECRERQETSLRCFY